MPFRYKEGMLLAKHGTETPVMKDIQHSVKEMVEVTEKKGYEAVNEWEVDEILEWTNGLNFDSYVSTWKEYATSATSGKITGKEKRTATPAQTTSQKFATNLSISSSYNRSVKIRLVANCHLQTFYNLLKQFAASLLITSFDNQLATSLLTTCNRLVVNKLSQVMQPIILRSSYCNNLLQDVNRLVATCVFLAV